MHQAIAGLLPVLVTLAGCAVVYVPPVANMGMPSNRGDLMVGAELGQASGVVGSYAVTDRVAIRGDASVDAPMNNDFSQYRADLGAQVYWAPGSTPDARAGRGPRLSASLDFGPGHVFDNVSAADLESGCDPDSLCFSSSADGPFRLSAWTLNTTAAGQVGYESRWFSAAFAMQLVEEHLLFDRVNANITVSPPDYLYGQPVIALRSGVAPLYVEMQAGLVLALYRGVSTQPTDWQWLHASVGLVCEFDRLGQGRRAFDSLVPNPGDAE